MIAVLDIAGTQRKHPLRKQRVARPDLLYPILGPTSFHDDIRKTVFRYGQARVDPI